MPTDYNRLRAFFDAVMERDGGVCQYPFGDSICGSECVGESHHVYGKITGDKDAERRRDMVMSTTPSDGNEPR
jgi:hypothetical protein